MLSAKNLTKIYKAQGEEVTALCDISIDFPENGMVFILGKSGSGKSTLLNMLGGLDKPTEGEIIIGGRSSKNFKASDFDGYRNTYVGFIFQEYNILEELTVAQNIELALELQGRKNVREDSERILEAVDMKNFGRRKPNTLSGGQKQRVAIARALVKDPKIIMADEPTGALDSVTGKEIVETLKKLSENRLVIVISHDEELARKYGDRIIELKDGRIVSDESQNNYVPVFVPESADFIKSRMPIGCAVKIGVNGLKHHTFRLIMTLIVATLSFSLFGFASTLMLYDPNYTVAELVADFSYPSALIYKTAYGDRMTTQYDDANPSGKTTVVEYSNKVLLSGGDIAELNRHAASKDMEFTGVFCEGKTQFTDGTIINMKNTVYLTNSTLWTPDGFVNCGKEYLSRHFGDPVAGRYPERKDEVAISEYFYDMFAVCGFTSADGIAIKPSQPYDLCGKKLGLKIGAESVVLEIVGIYDLGDVELDKIPIVSDVGGANNDDIGFPDATAVISGLERSFNKFMFVADDFCDEYADESSDRVSQTFTPGYSNLGWYVGARSIKPGQTGLGREWFSYEQLKTYGEDIYYFSEGNTNVGIGKDECVLSCVSFALYISKLVNARRGSDVYALSHPDVVAAADKLTEFMMSTDDSAAVISFEDLAVMSSALARDWGVWVKDNDFSGEYYESDWNKIFCADENGIVKDCFDIIGVSLARNVSFVVAVDKNFITDTASSWSYFEEKFASKYIESGEGKYGYAVTPFSGKTDQSYFLLDYGRRDLETDVSYGWKNSVVDAAKETANGISKYSWIFLLSGFVTGLIAALFLFNYITMTVFQKKKEIGILRALGARGGDLFKIFFSESLVIVAICFILSSVISGVLCFVIGDLIFSVGIFSGVRILRFGILDILIILGVMTVVAFSGTFLPVCLVARKSPVETIRE